MVAVIHSSSSIKNALHYNENKVRQNMAKFIHSGNYHKDTELLGFSDKLFRLGHLTQLNKRVRTNSVHISLNFDVSDKLDEEKLKAITDEYLKEIGFGEQPYLVYQHYDAGHPHIHIVTTNIKSTGERISLHNLGRIQSEKARKELEQQFGLTKADGRPKNSFELKPIDVPRVQYGKSETKRAISNVLNYVLPIYKYASLAELNAILRLYNVLADRGSENSRIYKGKGLVYRILDKKGEKIGLPVKASLICSKPTLKNIEARFDRNEAERQQYKRRLINAIDYTLLKRQKQSLQQFTQALQKENIAVVFRQNENGIVYGITYVDHHTRCVFNGSHLGKQYSANAIQQRINIETQFDNEQSQHFSSKTLSADFKEDKIFDTGISKLFDDLIKPETDQYAAEPAAQKQFRKKRKRRQQQTNL